MRKNSNTEFSQDEIGRMIEMAWEDRTPFEAIEANFQITEPEVIDIIRREIKNLLLKLGGKELMEKPSTWPSEEALS